MTDSRFEWKQKFTTSGLTNLRIFLLLFHLDGEWTQPLTFPGQHYLLRSECERIQDWLRVVSSPGLLRQLVTFSREDHFFSEEISRWPAPQSDTSMFFLLNVKGDYGWKSEGYWLSDNPPIIHLPPGTYCKADILVFLGNHHFLTWL